MKCECGSHRGRFWHGPDTWTCDKCGADWQLQPIIAHTPVGPLRRHDHFYHLRSKPRARTGWLEALSTGGDVRSGLWYINARADNGAARAINVKLIQRIDFDHRIEAILTTRDKDK